MPTNDRSFDRLPLDTLATSHGAVSRLPSYSSRVISSLLPRMLETLELDQLPVFEQAQRPQEDTSEPRTDVDGKQWTTIQHWLERAQTRARFTMGAVTLDLEVTEELATPLPLTSDEIEAELVLSAERTREMAVWWRVEADGRYRLTISYEFPDDGEREFIRGSILGDTTTRIDIRWTHRARYQPEDDGGDGPSIHDRVGAPRDSTMRTIERHPVATDVAAASRIRDGVIPVRPTPTESTATPIYYSFSQQASEPLVYPVASHSFWQDGPSKWRWVNVAPGRVMYYRFTGYESTYEHLPTELRMGFDETSGSPALRPYVHEDDDGDPLVDIAITVEPHVDPEAREALRALIQEREGDDFAILVPPVITGTLQLDVGLMGAEAPAEKLVGLGEPFDLGFSFGSEHWAPNMETLSQPNGGAHGRVYVDVLSESEGLDASVPVVLQLDRLHPDVVEVLRVEEPEDGVPRRFQLRNRIERPVRISAVTIHLADQAGDAAPPTNVRKGRQVGDLPTKLEPLETIEVEIEPVEGDDEWNALYVDLGDVEVDAPEDGWLEAIHEKASSSLTTRRVTVRATNLGAEAVTVPEYDSTQVWLEATSADPPSGRLKPGDQEWSSKLSLALADLWALDRDPTRDAPYVLEWRSDYSDLTGLPQRMTSTRFTPSIRALLTERTDSRYDLLDDEGEPLETDLDRATVQERIVERRDAGETWRLRVVVSTHLVVPGSTETIDPPDPTGTETSSTTETETPSGQPWSLYIQPFGVDFAADVRVATVHITYTHADGRVETSEPINLLQGGPTPTDASVEWTVQLLEGDPRRFDYTVDYLGYDGRKDHVSLEGVTEPLIWLERPAAPPS